MAVRARSLLYGTSSCGKLTFSINTIYAFSSRNLVPRVGNEPGVWALSIIWPCRHSGRWAITTCMGAYSISKKKRGVGAYKGVGACKEVGACSGLYDSIKFE